MYVLLQCTVRQVYLVLRNRIEHILRITPVLVSQYGLGFARTYQVEITVILEYKFKTALIPNLLQRQRLQLGFTGTPPHTVDRLQGTTFISVSQLGFRINQQDVGKAEQTLILFNLSQISVFLIIATLIARNVHFLIEACLARNTVNHR